MEFHCQQVADGVGIFVSIQSARRDAPWVGLDVAVGALELGLHEPGQCIELRCGARNALGWHLTRADLLNDFFPGLAIFRDRAGGGKRGEV